MSTSLPTRRRRQTPASPRSSGLLLGIGLGGFVDGIVLHQVLQWHNMLSAQRPPNDLAGLRVNVTADGLFHAATWLAVAAGLVALHRLARRGGRWAGRQLAGWMLTGWGAFNLVEGVVDHHLLQVHRVRPDAAAPMAWDLGFLAFGALLVVVGWLLARSGSRVSEPRAGG